MTGRGRDLSLCDSCPYGPAPGEAGRADQESKLCDSKRIKKPGTCHRPAGWGTPQPGFGRCKLHGGLTPRVIRSAERARVRRLAATYGLPITGTDPGEALLGLVDGAAGHVAWLADLIRNQDPGALVWGVADETERSSGEFPGVDRKLSAVPSVWLGLYQEERKFLAQVAKDVVALRLEERRDNRVATDGEKLIAMLSAVLDAVGVGTVPELAARVGDLVSRVLRNERVEEAGLLLEAVRERTARRVAEELPRAVEEELRRRAAEPLPLAIAASASSGVSGPEPASVDGPPGGGVDHGSGEFAAVRGVQPGGDVSDVVDAEVVDEVPAVELPGRDPRRCPACATDATDPDHDRRCGWRDVVGRMPLYDVRRGG